jgi:hypothetical protein
MNRQRKVTRHAVVTDSRVKSSEGIALARSRYNKLGERWEDQSISYIHEELKHLGE